MSLSQLQSTLEQFVAAGGIAESKPAEDPELVHQLEAGTGLVFPTEFKEFYSIYSWLDIGPDSILSLPKVGDAILERRGKNGPIPGHWVPVMPDGAGGCYFVVCAKAGQASSSEFGCVMFVSSDAPSDAEYKHSDLLGFLISRVEFWSEDL